jgi:hypothetical protein
MGERKRLIEMKELEKEKTEKINRETFRDLSLITLLISSLNFFIFLIKWWFRL